MRHSALDSLVFWLDLFKSLSILSYLLFMCSLTLKLEDIKGGNLEQDYSCSVVDFPDLGRLAEDEGTLFSDPLIFHLRFQLTGRMVEMDGTFSAVVQMSCSRCLRRFTRPLEGSFSLTFAPHREGAEPGEDVELKEDELGLIAYHADDLELVMPLQDQLIMALPISPVCDEGCSGLCSECGVDLNTTGCHCEKKPFLNKFSALADLKIKS